MTSIAFLSSIPSSLPILPLKDNVLLPSIVTKLTVCQSESQLLLRNPSSYIVCVPLQPSNSLKESKSSYLGANVVETTSISTIDLSQLFHYGCVAQVLEYEKITSDQVVLKVKGVCRSRIRDICNMDGGMIYEALLEHHHENDNSQVQKDLQLEYEDLVIFQSLCRTYVSKMRLIGVSLHVTDQLHHIIESNHVSYVANLLLYLIDSSMKDKLHALEILDIKQRLHEIHHVVTRYLQSINTNPIYRENEMMFDHIRRKFYICKEMHSISVDNSNDENVQNSLKPSYKRQFNVSAEDDEEIASLVERLNNANLPEHATECVKRDLNRLRKLPMSSADSAILRTYLEYICDLPWSFTDKRMELQLSSVKSQLDADHFGIEHVKKRILEYLSVLKMKKDAKPPIICFAGPPGVGKTTLGKSIASALHRTFHRISLGGVRDEAEIRGHRRTYVGALPGLLIHGMRQCKVQNPVILLDEIDKLVTNSNQGDPAAALLEVLDPAQNSGFVDHFINIPYDLSQTLFIATANSLDTIPRPLLDRMEVIQLDGYTFNEKLHIAQTHLVPKQIEAHGMSFSGLKISEDVLLHIIEKYTRESGVRNLERLIANVCRYKCREYADLTEFGKEDQFDQKIYIQDLELILDSEPYDCDALDSEETPGIVTGLAYSGSGNGGILMIEANYTPGCGRLKLTGSLGDVIKESAEIAVSWVKANAYALKLTNSRKEDLFRDIDLHIHLPSGAIPKDGPSAGITIVTCLVSLMSGLPVPLTTAMTGEVTLRGQVRPVGGIKEKIISAHRMGIKRIVLPAANRRDVLKNIPVEIQNEMTFVYCKSIWDVVEIIFDQVNTRFEPRYTSSL
ncbi:MAG: ATP-dependent protease La [Benjaminiella poitrasii]|nr:MAG: ATP-dependent protease La [Benjaminiella poitrasii]